MFRSCDLTDLYYHHDRRCCRCWRHSMQYTILFFTTTGVWRKCWQHCCTNGVHRPHNLPNVTRWIHQRREPRGGPACTVLRGFQISCSLAQFPIIYRVFMEKSSLFIFNSFVQQGALGETELCSQTLFYGRSAIPVVVWMNDGVFFKRHHHDCRRQYSCATTMWPRSGSSPVGSAKRIAVHCLLITYAEQQWTLFLLSFRVLFEVSEVIEK